MKKITKAQAEKNALNEALRRRGLLFSKNAMVKSLEDKKIMKRMKIYSKERSFDA